MNRITDIMDKFINSLKLHKYVLFSFGLVFLILSFFAISHLDVQYYYDSGGYAGLAESFVKDGSFSFLNVTEVFRGYALSFIIYICNSIGDFFGMSRNVVYELLNATMITALITLIVPYMLKIKHNFRYVIGSVVFSGIFSYFWIDFLYFPLSDMWALFFFSIGISIFAWLESSYFNGEHNTSKKYILYILFGGACFYIAYNMRSVYEIPVYLTIIIFVFRNRKFLFTKKLLLLKFVFLLVVGSIIPALPQIMINYNATNKISAKIQASYSDGVSLSLRQLYWGINTPRYETSVENLVGFNWNYPHNGIRFIDTNGDKLLAELGTEVSMGNLLNSYIKHPIMYTKIYLRHVINGLNPIFRESYITNVVRDKSLAFNLNFVIVFLASLVFVRNFKSLYIKSFYLISFAIAGAIAIPGALELRFTLPIFIFIYGLTCFKLELKSFIFDQYKYPKIAALLILLVASYWYNYRIIDSTLKTNVGLTPLYIDGLHPSETK